MLVELRIENFAIIDQLKLELGDGLVIFTGETGAGKSIIIDAVETLLGVRADMGLIRTGSDYCNVEGTFRIGPQVREAVHEILRRETLLDDQNFLTLGREFRHSGRNSARVNGRTVTVSLLRELGELLIDLHGQSEHLSLLRVPSHLGLLDRFAEVESELSAYRETYGELQEMRKELRELRNAEVEAARKVELLTFQVEEIDMAGLQAGEEESLKEERTRLANVENLAMQANIAVQALQSDDPETPSGVDILGGVLEAMEDLAKIDESQNELAERAQTLFESANDLARDLSDYLESIEFNPKRLEKVEERLALIQSLKRKYGEDIGAILAFGETARKQLDDITHAEERIAELSQKEGKLLKTLTERSIKLSAKRHSAADLLSGGVESELKDLKMERARFGVAFTTRPDANGIELSDGERIAFDSNGHEGVEFMVEPNPGEGLKPLVKIASGGETARLMLAMKNVLARADHTPSLIFDEIDQGIGGRVGAVVGDKLWSLGREHQVLCITHLAQLAGFGNQHFKVEKGLTEDGRTTTSVRHLEGNDRLMELAQMLGDVSEGTLQSANEILQSVKQATAAG
jgi:DNA repair protein RecN (Recombination protein N)